MVVCPEGHDSEATDYCDTCGTPIVASPLRVDEPGGGPGTPAEGGLGGAAAPARESVLDLGPVPAEPQTCPHCGALNVADALFCESCGYDFTTGAPPLGSEPEPTPGEPDADTGPDPAGEAAAAAEVDPEAEPEDEPEPEPEDEVEPEPEAEPEDEVEPEPEPEADEEAEAEPEDEDEPEPEAEPDAPSPVEAEEAQQVPSTSHVRPRHTPPSRDLADTWVVEVWIDPDWYAVQQTQEACPSTGIPDVVTVQRTVALIGRPSSSLGARPDIDAGADSAVSRRHAQLTSDGRRWWIEDLGSSNGTYVGVVGEPLPTTPLPPGQRVEIDRDDRIYVGAWTRLVLRQATESERRGTG